MASQPRPGPWRDSLSWPAQAQESSIHSAGEARLGATHPVLWMDRPQSRAQHPRPSSGTFRSMAQLLRPCPAGGMAESTPRAEWVSRAGSECRSTGREGPGDREMDQPLGLSMASLLWADSQVPNSPRSLTPLAKGPLPLQ